MSRADPYGQAVVVPLAPFPGRIDGWSALGLALLAFGAAAGVRSGLASGAWAEAGALIWLPGQAEAVQGPWWRAWLAEVGRQVAWGPGPAWTLGLTAVGAPLALGVVWLRGYLLGLSLAGAWATAGPVGLPALLVGLLPAHLAGCAAALATAGASVRFASTLLKAAAGIQPHQLPFAFRRYLWAGCGGLLGAVAAAALNSLGMQTVRALL